MLEFKDLPYIVNKQIVCSLFSKTGSINRRLAFLGVCHDWRQIALPMVYHSIHVRECSVYDRAPVEQWRLPSPSGRLWNLNIAPFNAHDLARYAKSLRIVISSLEGFEDLKSLLEYITSLYSCGWDSIPKIDLWIIGVRFDGYSPTLIPYIQSLSAYIFGTFTGISKLCVFTTFMASCFNPLIDQLTTGYSANLQSLSMSYPVSFSNPIQLHNLTVLDLKLAGNRCTILSFVNPPNLRKLYLTGASGIYIWKYFSSPFNGDEVLNFAMLEELHIESNGKFRDSNDGGYNSSSDEGSDVEPSFALERRRVCKDWEYDIYKRSVVFPILSVLRVNGGHFGDLLFQNCTFPDKIDRLYLCDNVDLIRNSSWFLEHIPTNYVCIVIESYNGDYLYIPESEKIIESRLGRRINTPNLDFSVKINPAVVDLPMLRILQIDIIHFSVLVKLLSRLPSLRRLSIGLLEGDGTFEAGYLDVDRIVADPFSPSIAFLKIERISSTFTELKSFYIKALVLVLPNLSFVTLQKEFAGILKAFVLDNCVKYPRFRALFSNIYVA